jgi:hypothetical protein
VGCFSTVADSSKVAVSCRQNRLRKLAARRRNRGISCLFVVGCSLLFVRSRRSHGQNHPRYRVGALIFYAEARTFRFWILDFGFGICFLRKPARSKCERVNAELDQLPHNFVYFRVISWFQVFFF